MVCSSHISVNTIGDAKEKNAANCLLMRGPVAHIAHIEVKWMFASLTPNRNLCEPVKLCQLGKKRAKCVKFFHRNDKKDREAE